MLQRGLSLILALSLFLNACEESTDHAQGPEQPPFLLDPTQPIAVALKDSWPIQVRQSTPISLELNKEYRAQGDQRATDLTVTAKHPAVMFSPWQCSKAGTCTSSISIDTSSADTSPYWFEYRISIDSNHSEKKRADLVPAVATNLSTTTLVWDEIAYGFTLASGEGKGYTTRNNEKAVRISTRNVVGLYPPSFQCDSLGVCRTTSLYLKSDASRMKLEYQVSTATDQSPWQALNINGPDPQFAWGKSTHTRYVSDRDGDVWLTIPKDSNKTVKGDFSYSSRLDARELTIKNGKSLNLNSSTTWVCYAGTCNVSLNIPLGVTEGSADLILKDVFGHESSPLTLKIVRGSIKGTKTEAIVRGKGKTSISFSPGVDYTTANGVVVDKLTFPLLTTGVTIGSTSCDPKGVCQGELLVDKGQSLSGAYVAYRLEKQELQSSWTMLNLTNSLTAGQTEVSLYDQVNETQLVTLRRGTGKNGYSSTLTTAPLATGIQVLSTYGINLSPFSCDKEGVCTAKATGVSSGASFDYRVETNDEISNLTHVYVNVNHVDTVWNKDQVSFDLGSAEALNLKVQKATTTGNVLGYRSPEVATRIEVSELSGIAPLTFQCNFEGQCEGSTQLLSGSSSGSAKLVIGTEHSRSKTLILKIRSKPTVFGNLTGITWTEGQDTSLTIDRGVGLGYTSENLEPATAVIISNPVGVSFGPISCDANGTCKASAVLSSGFYSGSFSYVVQTKKGSSDPQFVSWTLKAPIRISDLQMDAGRVTLTQPIVIPANLIKTDPGLNVDAVVVSQLTAGELTPFSCKQNTCTSSLTLPEGFDFTTPTSFKFTLKAGSVSSRSATAKINFKNAVVVKNANVSATRNREMIALTLEMNQHYLLVGLPDVTTLIPSVTDLPAGLSLYQASCIPDRKACYLTLKADATIGTDFAFNFKLSAPFVVPSLSIPGRISAHIEASRVDHAPIFLPFTGLLPDQLNTENLTVSIKPFEHYFDQDGDLAQKLLVRNAENLKVEAGACNADGICNLTLSRLENSKSNLGIFEVAVETRPGSASEWLSFKIRVSKLVRLAGVVGTPVRLRLGTETAIESTSLTNTPVKDGTLSCRQSFFGCFDEWSCLFGLCDSTITGKIANKTSSFDYTITQQALALDEGSVLVDWQSFAEDIGQRSRMIQGDADSTVDLVLSAGESGDITLPYGSDYVLTEVKIGHIQGGAFVKDQTFACFERECRAKFHIDANAFGQRGAYFQYQLVAFSKAQSKTLRPRTYAAISFDVKAAPPRVEPKPDESLTVTLSGSPAAVQQDILYKFTPAVSGLQPTDRFALTGNPACLRIDTSSGQVQGLCTESKGNQAAFTIMVLRDNRVVGMQAFTAAYQMDPLKDFAWHLENLGQSAFALIEGFMGADINQKETIASGITGRGVKVAVSDTGMEIGHPDLKANINKELSRNYACPLTATYCDPHDPTNSTSSGDHGTSVAGLIAAKGWNGIGSRGVAPNAELIGLNFLNNQATENMLDQYLVKARIVNQSWGRNQELPAGYSPMSAQENNAIETALKDNSTVFVKAAGNSFSTYGNSNFDPNASHRGIIVVGALNAFGLKSSYSSIGSNIWIAAPGGEYGMDTDVGSPYNQPAMITTDQSSCTQGYSTSYEDSSAFNRGENPLNKDCNYTNGFNGTSSAAPVTSGVIALMLEANPKLSWRDVKHILASSARPVDESFPGLKIKVSGEDFVMEPAWTTNAAGYCFHNWYGFGAIDADAAVAMAQRDYKLLLPEIVSAWLPAPLASAVDIPDANRQGLLSSMEFAEDQIAETISIKVNVTHRMPGDIGLELTSPSGTKSVVLNVLNSNFGQDIDDIIFLSNAFYGENTKGTWTLRVIDGVTGIKGQLKSWSLKIQGRKN